ncbi:MAG: hypothetical protein AAFP88_01495 [Bacteroidota bacterium]
MEKDLYKLFYLLVSIIYAIFRRREKHTHQEPTETPLPTSTATPDWEGDWDEEIEMATPDWEEAVEKEIPLPVHYATAKTPSASVMPSTSSSSQHPLKKRILGRYKGWKKAMVMGEVMRPYL